eukprot:scaffold11577_cov128-Amphora_coffeaeformis.AAC.1
MREHKERKGQSPSASNRIPSRLLAKLAICVASLYFARALSLSLAKHQEQIAPAPQEQTANSKISNQTSTDTTSDTSGWQLPPSPACQSLATKSAMSIWVEHIDDILAASRLPRDRNYLNHDVVVQILRMITPRLSLSQRSYSRDFAVIQRVLRKAHERYTYLKNDNKEGAVPPPLQVVVMGGSVTM